ncbi:MAG: S8 family serine peptidase [Acidobacteriota bacterium]|nr:S8 family serine peptidase [Acidobacteriota bacterium]
MIADRFAGAVRVVCRCASFVLCAALLAPAAGAEVSWKSGSRSAPTPMDDDKLRERLSELAGRDGKSRVTVFFDGPIDQTRRAMLKTSGVELLGYLGDNAYFATLTEALDLTRAGAVRGLVAVEPIETIDKLHPDLAAGIAHPWAIVGPGEDRKDRPKEESPLNPEVAVYVLFHADVDLARRAPVVIGRHAGQIRSYLHSVNGVVVHLLKNEVPLLASEDEVMWVEPPLPQLEGLNDSNRPRVQAETLNAAPYGLDGSGVTVLVYDAGQMFQHEDFAGRLTIGPTDTSGTSDHATHVGGTIGGDGSGSAGQYRGMAPGVDLISYGFEQEGGLSEGFLYTDPGDIEVDYTAAITQFDADISNNSIGTNTASNGYPCDWEGNYGTTGALIDEIVRGFTGEPFRIVWANGNERGSGRCGSTYTTTAPPACAKNHITVGALNSDTDGVTSFTSWGPCDDERLKPDVSGPGCQASDDNGVTSSSSSGGYNVKCGTSMASPTVAGVGALLLQQYRASFPGEPDFRNATLKAILANTAEDIVETGPDFQSGYGSVRGVPAADTIIEGRFLEAEVSQGEIYSFIVLVTSEDTELKVTLAWDDPAGTPNVNPVLVNDLDLRVIDASETVHFPWTLDAANPATPAVRTGRDGVNNIEQVVIDAPAPGAYRVEIEGFNIAQGPTQPFGIAASPSLINCAPAGNVSTGVTRIACSADMNIQVIDCDLNTDDAVVDTVDITVVSDSEPGGEIVTLTESAPESALLAGTIPVDTTDGPGVLAVSEGDTITVTYIDADDGDGGTNVPVTRDVTVDCTPPVITGVTMDAVNPRDALATITIDEPARVIAEIGTVCGVTDDTVSSLSLNTLHTVRFGGLVDDTTYFFTVEAIDEAGNTSFDDNGGACYSFTTPEIPEFFTEQFSTGIDLVGSVLTFTPNNSVDFYEACLEPLTGALPTDPTGGTDSGLGDDQPTSFVIDNGNTVSLYGQSYSTVWVGPNGFLTFGEGDSDYTESFSEHFDTPRVAGMWDDINPASGGSVSWRQLADRIAVTWEDVPEYSTSNSNTFQIEMFYDGRIRLSWLALDSGDAVVGLSAGTGLDPDFFESDLSAGPGCGPRPPFVQDLVVQTAEATPVGIALAGSDDGLPEPASLTLRVTSLPAIGTLTDDGNGGTITSVPYELVGGGDAVTYTPAAGWLGPDAFTYVADDGGVAPDGGTSGTGTVSITIGGTMPVYEFLVDDADPGWTTTGDWAFGQPAGGGSHNNDPDSGFTGVNVYGYDLTGDYPDDMNPEYLTSKPMDLSGVTETVLEFQRWLGVESSTYDHATVEISTDGTSWSMVWDHSGSAISEGAWSLRSYDISAIADGQPAVWVRWIMGDTDGSVTYPGWNIDDIRIIGVIPAACLGAPAEVRNVTFAADRQTLTWSPSAYQGGTVPVYDTIRSTAPDDFEGGSVCIESDDADTTATDAQAPAVDEVFYYLIRAENDCGSGSLGVGAGGARTAISCSLP